MWLLTLIFIVLIYNFDRVGAPGAAMILGALCFVTLFSADRYSENKCDNECDLGVYNTAHNAAIAAQHHAASASHAARAAAEYAASAPTATK